MKGQIDDLLHEIRDRVERGERVLVTTSKRHYGGGPCRYCRSRRQVPIRIRKSRRSNASRSCVISGSGEFDVLIWWLTFLREGLDLPEVSLAAILDADKRRPPSLLRFADPTIAVRAIQRSRHFTQIATPTSMK